MPPLVAMVGLSCSGKSTILHRLCGTFDDPICPNNTQFWMRQRVIRGKFYPKGISLGMMKLSSFNLEASDETGENRILLQQLSRILVNHDAQGTVRLIPLLRTYKPDLDKRAVEFVKTTWSRNEKSLLGR